MTSKGRAIAPDVALDDLSIGMPGISPRFGASLAEAATICFEGQSHLSGVRMNIDGNYNQIVAVHWPPITDVDQARRCWADAQVATEHGAYGVASLLVIALTELTVLSRSRKGTGFDYWLGPKGETDPLFQNKVRFEVSGIARGDGSAVDSRARRKLKQTERSDHTKLPALVAVVEFGSPRTRLVKR